VLVTADPASAETFRAHLKAAVSSPWAEYTPEGMKLSRCYFIALECVLLRQEGAHVFHKGSRDSGR
jgi:hypothetical protein